MSAASMATHVPAEAAALVAHQGVEAHVEVVLSS